MYLPKSSTSARMQHKWSYRWFYFSLPSSRPVAIPSGPCPPNYLAIASGRRDGLVYFQISHYPHTHQVAKLPPLDNRRYRPIGFSRNNIIL